MPTLPTGGGAMRSIGEKFSANAANGTGSLSVPIAITAARGLQPELSLLYDSGSGNGPFGAGWRLSVANITRKTDRQLPTYLDADDADAFVMSGAEDLVPCAGGPAGVQRYRPRVEGGFARIERNTADGAWRTTNASNVTSRYGSDAQARIVDPADPRRVFSWLIDRTEDALGNVVVFEYVEEDAANVPATAAEQHRLDQLARFTNRYLKRIRYGNTVAHDETTCLFEVVFDYGDHIGDTPDRTPGLWPARADAFSTYRAGFEIRTYRLCRRVMVFHHIPELSATPYLVGSTAFTYDGDAALAHLIAVEQRAHRRAGDGYDTEALPAVKLRYTVATPSSASRAVSLDRAGDVAGGIDGARHQWVDLDAEGIPGVLTDGDGALYFRRNLGDGRLGPPRALISQPSLTSLAGGGQQLVDVGGDGRLDLVALGPPLPGFFERVPTVDGEGDWEPFRPFPAVPQLTWTDRNVRFIDLDGDGRDDVLLVEQDAFVWYPSLGKDGYGPPRRLPRPDDEELGAALVFKDATSAIVMADLNGDGLRDLVRVENGRVCYWPNVGYGRFGAKVTMANAPVFDAPDQFAPERILFADIDGTGASDLLYARRDGVRFWTNLAGNAWSEVREVSALPPNTRAASVTAVDLLGTGTACLVWSSALPADPTIYYVDLTGGTKPHILEEVDNQLGVVTRVRYAPSTKFYLADRAAGIHWDTQLGFPVHVVERVETYDAIRRLRFVSTYTYRNGYFDGFEREFRGFGYVEQRDTESEAAAAGIGLFADRPPPVNGEYARPVVVTKTWFHTGAWHDRGPGERIVVPDLPVAESRDAYRALRGRPLRQEVCAEDGISDAPYTVTEHGYEVRRLQPRAGDTHGVFVAYPRETISWQYERDLADPRVMHELTLGIDDLGHVRTKVTIGYPRRAGAGDVRPEQTALLATISELDVANGVEHDDWYRHGVPLESRAYELRGLASPAGDAVLSFEHVKSVADAAVAIAYDASIPAGASKRLVERTRTRYYDTDALPEPLPFGAIDRRALGYESESLVFTPSLLASLYGDRVTAGMLLEGGYRQDDDGWWAPSGRSVPDASRFYMPVEYLDPFGNPPTRVAYAHALVVTSVTDARDNTTTIETDYRTMTPTRVIDANGAASQVEFDVLGRVRKIWMIGRGEGDVSSNEPTATLDYAFYDAATGQPTRAHRAARETHGDPATRWQHSYTYFDGTGREVMRKVQAEPGKAMQIVDGECIEVDANPRWVGTGRTVFDNKGNAIKQYEPYFSVTSDYENEDALVCAGVTPLLHYDPLGRLMLTEHPDGSTTRVDFTPWRQTSYDANDTLAQGNVWLERALAGNAATQRAAALALDHADTPSVTLFDTLGRPFAAIANNKTELLETSTTFDIEGNPLVVTDALGRPCASTAFSMLGQACHSIGIDGGERWSIVDVAGQPLRRWDAIGDAGERVVRVVYDQLHRPLEIWVTVGANADILAERTIYGEDAPDPTPYLRGRIYRTFDGAGIATNEAYDFKGNALRATRQLVRAHDMTPDWAQSPPLDDELFRVSTQYDALDRVVRSEGPDGSVTWTSYDDASRPVKIEVQIRGAADRTTFVDSIDYDAKGRRTKVVYGAAASSAATTTYEYDPLTFRLRSLVTTRARGTLQDLAYTYDPVGNIVRISDAVIEPAWWNGSVTDGTALYTYDPVYRLATAQAREHAGGFAAPRTDADLPIFDLPNQNEDQALIPYFERYTYDAVGNIELIEHGPPNGAPAWTSPMHYTAGTNRLASTMLEGDDRNSPHLWTGVHTYDARGNMTRMPHLAVIDWDWKNQMQRADKGGGGNVYFTYDAGGERVRKVWVHGATVDERIYLAGYEVYRQRKSGTLVLERQTTHVMDGSNRIAMVETKTVDADDATAIATPVIRIQLGNHLGSVMVELSATGDVISYEEFHPFGTTAYRARGAAEVSIKRYRYTGKERDEETSLEYHGARYYAPWLCRWSATDPKGFVDSTNLYLYVANRPVIVIDPNGKEITADTVVTPDMDPDLARKIFTLRAKAITVDVAHEGGGGVEGGSAASARDRRSEYVDDQMSTWDDEHEKWIRSQSFCPAGATCVSDGSRLPPPDPGAEIAAIRSMNDAKINEMLFGRLTFGMRASAHAQPEIAGFIAALTTVGPGITPRGVPGRFPSLRTEAHGAPLDPISIPITPSTAPTQLTSPPLNLLIPPSAAPVNVPVLLELPTPPGRKVVATSPGGPITLSGAQASAIPGYDGLPAVGAWESAQQTGIRLTPSGRDFLFGGVPGSYAATHAEPQQLFLNPALTFMEVSKPPCSLCVPHISQTAQFRDTTITVLSPAGFQWFLPNGQTYPSPSAP